MNIDTGKIYKSQADAKAAGVPDDRLVTGTKEAIAALKKRLFPKRKRAKL